MSCNYNLSDFLKNSALYEGERCIRCVNYIGDHLNDLMTKSKVSSIGPITEKPNIAEKGKHNTDELEVLIGGSESEYALNIRKRHLDETTFGSSKSSRNDESEHKESFNENGTTNNISQNKFVASSRKSNLQLQKSSSRSSIAPPSSSSSSAQLASSSSSASLIANENDNAELQFIGYTGTDALTDFPHARENCGVHEFKPGIEIEKCINCYCYVCDFPANQCPEWENHCKATYTSLMWKTQRETTAKSKNITAASSSSASESSHISRRGAFSDFEFHPNATWKTYGELLKAIEQVYPVESLDPPGLADGVVLRPYQRQSLAFMLDIERRISEKDSTAGCGGWLCDEMGMGKTAVCASLILANPLPNIVSTIIPNDDKTLLKTTLIVTNPTLVQQWISELNKFAPG